MSSAFLTGSNVFMFKLLFIKEIVLFEKTLFLYKPYK